MPKLQEIKRSNMSLVYSVNIPLEEIERLGWKKGEELVIESVVVSEGVLKLIIFKEIDNLKIREGLNGEI